MSSALDRDDAAYKDDPPAVDLDAIEAKARAAMVAAPGVWRTYEQALCVGRTRRVSWSIGTNVSDKDDDFAQSTLREVSEHIAAANPATVLTLVALTRELAEALEDAASIVDTVSPSHAREFYAIVARARGNSPGKLDGSGPGNGSAEGGET